MRCHHRRPFCAEAPAVRSFPRSLIPQRWSPRAESNYWPIHHNWSGTHRCAPSKTQRLQRCSMCAVLKAICCR